MRIKNIIKIGLFMLFLALSSKTQAQTYPVNSNVVLIPPYSLKIPDYTVLGANNLQVNVHLNDLLVVSYDVKLRFVIRSSSAIISTKLGFTPTTPITLQGGVPKTLSGLDLAEYLDYSNLDFQGISKSQIQQNGGKLPEGVYQFSVEVYDYRLNVKVSNSASVAGWLILNDPPILNLPTDTTKLIATTPQNVLFQWTPRHLGSPNSAFATEYIFTLVEVFPNSLNPNQAILGAVPVYTTTSSSSTLVYGPAEPTLIPGRKYAWRVKAKDLSNKDLFKNNGFSEVYSFTYGDACLPPTNLSASVLNSEKIKVEWSSEWNHSKSQVEIRKHNTSGQWIPFESFSESQNITQLNKGMLYDYRVQGFCGTVGSSYISDTISTPGASENDFNCGTPILDSSTTNMNKLLALNPNESFKAYDFTVISDSVTKNGDGTFTGTGTMKIPAFAQLRFEVTFDNITINTDKVMIAGDVFTVYDASRGMFIDIDKIIGNLDSIIASIKGGNFKPTGNGSPTIDDTTGFPITGVTTSGTAITITGANGKSKTVQKSPDGTTVIQGSGGSTYLVDSNGNTTNVGTQTSKVIGGKFKKNKNETFGNSTNRVIFAENSTQKYGFDLLTYPELEENYQIIDNNTYRVAWKSVKAKGADKVNFTVQGTILDSNLIVRTRSGFEYNFTKAQSVYTIDLIAGENFDVQDVFCYEKIGASEELIGKLNVTFYPKNKIKLNVVNISGQAVNKTALETYLKSVFKHSVIEFEVSVDTSFHIADSTIMANGLDQGSPDQRRDLTSEMKAIRNEYLSHAGMSRNFTVFLIDEFTDPSTKGYFPTSKYFGFVAVNNNSDYKRTVAHEIAHGVGNVEHAWEQFDFNKSISTTLLMDYDGGNKLTYTEWGFLQNPGISYSWAEKNSKDKAVYLKNLSPLSKFKNSDNISYSFYTPAGKIISLPENATNLKFSTGSNWSCNKFKIIPIGVLLNFSIGDYNYTSFANSDCSQFTGYADDSKPSNQKYKDIYSSIENINRVYPKAIFCYPYNKDYQVKFYAVEMTNNHFELFTNYFVQTTNFTPQEPYIGSGVLLDFSKTLKDFPKTEGVSLNLQSNFGNEANDFLNRVDPYIKDQGSKTSLFAFINASLINRHKTVYNSCAFSKVVDNISIRDINDLKLTEEVNLNKVSTVNQLHLYKFQEDNNISYFKNLEKKISDQNNFDINRFKDLGRYNSNHLMDSIVPFINMFDDCDIYSLEINQRLAFINYFMNKGINNFIYVQPFVAKLFTNINQSDEQLLFNSISNEFLSKIFGFFNLSYEDIVINKLHQIYFDKFGSNYNIEYNYIINNIPQATVGTYLLKPYQLFENSRIFTFKNFTTTKTAVYNSTTNYHINMEGNLYRVGDDPQSYIYKAEKNTNLHPLDLVVLKVSDDLIPDMPNIEAFEGKFLMPAFMAYWLKERKGTEFKTQLTILVAQGFIIYATAGTATPLVLAGDILLLSAELTVLLKRKEILSMPYGKSIVKGIDVINTILTVRAIYKAVNGTLRYISEIPEDISNNIDQLSIDQLLLLDDEFYLLQKNILKSEVNSTEFINALKIINKHRIDSKIKILDKLYVPEKLSELNIINNEVLLTYKNQPYKLGLIDDYQGYNSVITDLNIQNNIPTNQLADYDRLGVLKDYKYFNNNKIYEKGDLSIYSKKTHLIDENPYRVVIENTGNLAEIGSDLFHFLDDAFVLTKRAEVLASTLPSQFPNLSIDELTAIKVYTSDEVRNDVKIYFELNSQLRTGDLDDYYQGLNKLLNDGLNKLPTHNGNTVFRGIYGKEGTIADGWKKGDLVNFMDFKSSSTSIETAAYEFSHKQGFDVVLEIKNADGYNICNISCSPSEMEILLLSGQKFEVIDIVDNVQVFDPSYSQQNPFTKIILKKTP